MLWLPTSVLTALVLVGTVLAQSQSAQPREGSSGDELTAVNACTRHVRKVRPRPQIPFDAHFDADGRMRISGAPEEVQLFRECMVQRGYPAYSR